MRTRIGLANYFKARLLSAGRRDADRFAGVLQHFARPVNYDLAEAELVLDLYLSVL